MIAQIQLRRGTTAEWAASSVVLASGEPGFDTTLERMKIGNGTDLWASLPWATNADLESQIAALASGGPAGTYANLTALNEANPDHSKIYITLEDGNWCYYSGSAFVAGDTYQATAIADGSVTPIKTDFFRLKTSVNLFNKDDVNFTTGKYLSYVTGSEEVNIDWGYSDYIAVTAETEYQVYYAYAYQICYYDTSKTFQSGVLLDGSTYSFTTPASCVYIRVSLNLTLLDVMQITESATPIAKYAPYFAPRYVVKNENLDKECSYLTVDKFGNGDYTTIAAAVAAAQNGYTIIVNPGEYVEYVVADDKDISIIGIDKKQCVLTYSSGNYTECPLQLAAGYVANMTIWAKDDGVTTPIEENYAYAVHADYHYSLYRTLEFFNCDIISDWNYAVGLGTRVGMHAIFRNCNLTGNHAGASGRGGMYFHDAANITYAGVQHLTLDRCNIYATAEQYALRVDSLNMAGSTIYLHFIGNMVYSDTNGLDCLLTNNLSGEPDLSKWESLINFNLSGESFGNNLTEMNT